MAIFFSTFKAFSTKTNSFEKWSLFPKSTKAFFSYSHFFMSMTTVIKIRKCCSTYLLFIQIKQTWIHSSYHFIALATPSDSRWTPACQPTHVSYSWLDFSAVLVYSGMFQHNNDCSAFRWILHFHLSLGNLLYLESLPSPVWFNSQSSL